MKELTDDEDETSSSPKRQKVEEEEVVADEPIIAVPCGVHGAGGRFRGLGKRVISRHPSLLYAAIWTPCPSILPLSTCQSGSKENP
jgi:hypothetical protein